MGRRLLGWSDLRCCCWTLIGRVDWGRTLLVTRWRVAHVRRELRCVFTPPVIKTLQADVHTIVILMANALRLNQALSSSFTDATQVCTPCKPRFLSECLRS